MFQLKEIKKKILLVFILVAIFILPWSTSWSASESLKIVNNDVTFYEINPCEISFLISLI